MAKEQVKEAKKEAKAEEPKRVYVHVPGTVHLNAYEVAVDEAAAKVEAAKGEYEAAVKALEDKKASSQFVEEKDVN